MVHQSIIFYSRRFLEISSYMYGDETMFSRGEDQIWRITDKPWKRINAELDISHRDCLMTELSKRLSMDMNVRMPSDALQNGSVYCTFAVPEALSPEEIGNLFKGLHSKVSKATVYFGRWEREPVTGFEMLFHDEPIAGILGLRGCTIKRYSVTPIKENIMVDIFGVNPMKRLMSTVDKVEAVDIISTRSIDPMEEAIPRPILSHKEEELLRYLLEKGLYEIPKRGITLEKIAPEVGMSDSNLSLVLRRITSKVFAEYLRKAAKASVF